MNGVLPRTAVAGSPGAAVRRRMLRAIALSAALLAGCATAPDAIPLRTDPEGEETDPAVEGVVAAPTQEAAGEPEPVPGEPEGQPDPDTDAEASDASLVSADDDSPETETTAAEDAPEDSEAPPADATPVPDAEATPDERYRLRTGDEVQVEVFRERELSGAFRLRSDGAIRHPLLGAVRLEGLTVAGAEEHIRELLAADYLVNPRVALTVAEPAADLQVLVLGEVRRPGVVPMPPDGRLTLLQAIALAGGLTDMASPNRTILVHEVDGRSQRLRVRVGDLLAGRGRQRDVELAPDAVITVPEVRF